MGSRSWFGAAAAAVVLFAAAGTAQATWSIILVDTRTGEVAIGCATCLAGFDLKEGTPVLLTGIGAASAQSSIDTNFQNRTYIRDRLAEGLNPATIISQLATFDAAHQSRQYGIADVLGRSATFTGTGAGQWRGGDASSFQYTYVGQVGTVWYAIQGNVLTGAPVVQNAVEAAINTPGDLPEKLMASMEAARAFGGDGRCSCSPDNPPGCGSPPPMFTKSAHVAYMLIARAGDEDGTIGSYRVGTSPSWVAAGDLNGDTKRDLVVANNGSTNLSVLVNTTAPGRSFPSFASTPVNLASGSGPRWCGIGDVTGDGIPDVLAVNGTAATFSVWPGTGGGAFGARQDTSVLAQPYAAAIGNFDGINGLDAAVACSTTGKVSVLLNNGAGGFGPRVDVPCNADPRAIAMGDFDGDGDVDLVVPNRTLSQVTVLLNNGAGVFTTGPTFATPSLPTFLASGDFNNDGRMDVAVVSQTNPAVLTQLLSTGAPGVAFARTDFTLPNRPNGMTVGDVNGDGFTDVYLSCILWRTTVLNGSTAGLALGPSYDHQTSYSQGGFLGCELADLDNDGDLDAAIAYSGTGLNSTLIVPNRGPGPHAGQFVDGIGLALGNYFMTFNIADQPVGAPDPVVQLRGLFDPWRQALVGHADAVQSLVDPPVNMGARDPLARTMTVTLRDWQGVPVTSMPTVTVSVAPGSAGSTKVGAATSLGGGAYSVELTATGTLGTDRYDVRVDDGGRPVTLMPRPSVTVIECPSDFNHDGTVNSTDVSDFINQWFQDQVAGTLVTDFNGDGVVNSTDVSDLINAWFADSTGGPCA
jgi:hypothetical protein